MPRKLQIDGEKLIGAIEAGLPSKEIMDRFGIKSRAQLKCVYLDALVSRGVVAGFAPTHFGKNAPGKEIKVNKRGSLVIPRLTVEEMGFSTGDSFSFRKSRSGLSLRQNQ